MHLQHVMNENDIEVNIETTLEGLRFLYKVVSKAHNDWPGGPPAEQEQLKICRDALYVILMETLLDNDLV